MEFKFEKLIIWQKGMEFGGSINKLSWKLLKTKYVILVSKLEGL